MVDQRAIRDALRTGIMADGSPASVFNKTGPRPMKTKVALQLAADTLADLREYLTTGKVNGIAYDSESLASVITETLGYIENDTGITPTPSEETEA